MALRLGNKVEIVADVNRIADTSLSIVAADYSGITAADMSLLRQKARQSSVKLMVARITLVKRAFAGTKFECMNDALVGPVVLAFSDKEPSAPARLLRDFAKDNDKLVVKALSVGAGLLSPKELDKVASLPTYEEALAQLMMTLKAPITQFVRTTNEPVNKFVRTLAAIRDKKQSSAA